MKIQWQGSAFFLEASLGVYDRLGAHKRTPQGGGDGPHSRVLRQAVCLPHSVEVRQAVVPAPLDVQGRQVDTSDVGRVAEQERPEALVH